MICRGLKNNKLSLQEAIDKYEEFLDLDLLDEDHQEIVEELIAEAEEEEYYWSSAKRDVMRMELEDECVDEDELLSEDLNEENEDFDD
jgi:molybdopterin converting factor small subunit